jgi:hypothetical protein
VSSKGPSLTKPLLEHSKTATKIVCYGISVWCRVVPCRFEWTQQTKMSALVNNKESYISTTTTNNTHRMLQFPRIHHTLEGLGDSENRLFLHNLWQYSALQAEQLLIKRDRNMYRKVEQEVMIDGGILIFGTHSHGKRNRIFNN